jgi:hypothetical protein
VDRDIFRAEAIWVLHRRREQLRGLLPPFRLRLVLAGTQRARSFSQPPPASEVRAGSPRPTEHSSRRWHTIAGGRQTPPNGTDSGVATLPADLDAFQHQGSVSP